MADRTAMLMKRQKLLGDFGEFALRSDDLDDVLTEGCRLVSEALDSELAKVIEIEDGGCHAFVRAGVGWRPGVVGHARVPLNEKTSEAHALMEGRPIITQDIEAEDRFTFPEFMTENGVKALVNVPIFLPGGAAYGLLQVDAREPREFGQEDIEFLRTYSCILGPVIDRLHKKNALEVALEDKERLLEELQHRVKNHLGIIMSLIRIRARNSAQEARDELMSVGERVEALRIVHEQLCATGTVTQLRLRPYVKRLAENLLSLHAEQSGRVELDIEAEEVDVRPDTAVPLGLILNEFITNSLKYAFESRGGTIRVQIVAIGEATYEIRMSDNGRGLPKTGKAAGSGLGHRLIDGLAGQIDATPHWSVPGEAGTELRLVFKNG